MAKLRVGDIEIDGSNVTIHPPSNPTPQQRGPALDSQTIRFLRWLPVSRKVLVLGGGALGVGGATLVVPAVAAETVGWGLFLGGIVLAAGFGLVATGIAKHLVILRPGLVHLAALGSDARVILNEVTALLGQDRETQTLDWIVGKLGYPREQVIHALALLIKRGVITEFVDANSGSPYYVSNSAFGPQDIDSLLTTLRP